MRLMKNICSKDTPKKKTNKKTRNILRFTIGAALKGQKFVASKIGATLKGMNLLPMGANLFL